MQELHRAYADRADFLTVYVKEAHPLDEWQMDSNEEQGVCYAQPVTFADRVAIARDFVRRCEHTIPFAIDPIENPADEVYAAWPERLYVVDERGLVAYKGGTGPFGYHPEEVAAWLLERFPPRDRAPASLDAETCERAPLALRALETSDDGRWRFVIDANGAWIGEREGGHAVEPAAASVAALRSAVLEVDYFGLPEVLGTPRVGGTTKSLAITLSDRTVLVHAYAPPRDEGPESGSAWSAARGRFDRVWTALRALDPKP